MISCHNVPIAPNAPNSSNTEFSLNIEKKLLEEKNGSSTIHLTKIENDSYFPEYLTNISPKGPWIFPFFLPENPSGGKHSALTSFLELSDLYNEN